MNLRRLLVSLGKLLLGGAAFYAGLIAGGMLATVLSLHPPAVPAGVDVGSAMRNLLLTSPILALALALLARGLGGSFPTRTRALAFLTWIAYIVNTQLEASIVSTFATGIPFTLVAQAIPSLLCGAAVAWLFPADGKADDWGIRIHEFFAPRSTPSWLWRLGAAAVAFMPIYFAFGLMVLPFVGEYYRQNLFGLKALTLEQLLPILFVRSVLFMLACLPVLVLWQKNARSLVLRLGFALYVFVGLLTLTADWLPLSVRLPHTLEIIADEFVYAGVLVWLLRGARATARTESRPQLYVRPMRG